MRLGVGLLIERQSLRGVAFAEVSAWIAAVVMLQRILGAFLLCVPISFLMSRQSSVSLFCVGSAMPVTSLLQIIQSLI